MDHEVETLQKTIEDDKHNLEQLKEYREHLNKIIKTEKSSNELIDDFKGLYLKTSKLLEQEKRTHKH